MKRKPASYSMELSPSTRPPNFTKLNGHRQGIPDDH